MKPTIFFSHSSLDMDRIKPIKDHIISETGNAVQIFLSSDGASIPFGKSWLREIEDALINCKLMFVWLTPASVKSSWIYFESGYAYSRGIKVVPLGFDGVKLEDVSPPLSILQGFNIFSASSLNNIVAVINDEFHLSFPAFFDDEYFLEFVESKASDNSADVLDYVDSLECIFYPRISDKKRGNDPILLKNNWPLLFEEEFNKREMPFSRDDGGEFFGSGFKIYPHNIDKDIVPRILIDPLVVNNLRETFARLSDIAYEESIRRIAYKVNLRDIYKLPGDHYIISSRLINTEVKFDTLMPNVLYRFRNIEFRINIWDEYYRGNRSVNRELILLVDIGNQEIIPLGSLIKTLVQRGIITKRE